MSGYQNKAVSQEAGRMLVKSKVLRVLKAIQESRVPRATKVRKATPEHKVQRVIRVILALLVLGPQ